MSKEASSGLAAPMPDVQSARDLRNVPIDRVGVKHITYPIVLHCPRTGGSQHTVAKVNMYVSLPHYQKGTHMSRFLEALNHFHQTIRVDQMKEICKDMRKRLQAQDAHMEVAFPYFLQKKAPVSGAPGMIDVQVRFEVSSNASEDFIMGVRVPATSLCPCSKEISAYGAHNQRCEIEARIRCAPGKYLWIEDLVELIEQSASMQVYPVLKRPDEKYVTEKAYDNPKFVEDIVRDLAVKLDADARIIWYHVTSENYESIHNHNAYAEVERDKR